VSGALLRERSRRSRRRGVRVRMVEAHHKMLLLMLLASLLSSVHCMRLWPLCTGQKPTIGLLPFDLEDALVPGEQRDVFLFEDRFRACVVDAAASDHGCLGALHFTETGEIVDFSSLLVLLDYKVDSTATWARLVCVSRLRLTDVSRSTSGYQTANIEPLTDESSCAADARPIVASLRHLHARTALQRRRLQELLAVGEVLVDEEAPLSGSARSPHIHVGPDKESPVPCGLFNAIDDDDDEADDPDAEFVFVGLPWERPQAMGICFFHCRDLGDLGDEENGKELDELIAVRHTQLLTAAACPQAASSASGDDLGSDAAAHDGDPAAAATALHGIASELWGVSAEEDLDYQLLSFAAAATLSPVDRVRALLMRDAAERIEFSIEALTEQQQQLTKLLEQVESEATRG